MPFIFLDSHVFLDYFLKSENERRSKEVISKIIKGNARGAVSTIALVEVKYKMLRMFGHDKAEESIFLIKNSPNMEVIGVSPNIAETAADIRFKYYKKNKNELSYADAIHIATALSAGCDLIVTGDPDFKNIDEIKSEVY